MKITIGAGIMPDFLLRLDLELVPLVRLAPGFLAYFAVAADESRVFTTRVFTDRESLEAETENSRAIAQSINEEFSFLSFETLIDGHVGVGSAFGPVSIFTP